ncbi:MAG: hypothetical protein ACTHV8_08015 [Nesterenkonia sp.]
MSLTAASEETGGGKGTQKANSQTEDIMADMASEYGRDGKDQANKLAGGNSAGIDKALDSDPASKGINLAQRAASAKAGDMAQGIGGQTGKTVAEDTTKIAAETAKGATKGAAAGGVGAVPGAITGAAKGAAQTKTGRITAVVILVPVIGYFAFISLLPLLFVLVLSSGGEQSEETGVLSDVSDFLFGEDDD